MGRCKPLVTGHHIVFPYANTSVLHGMQKTDFRLSSKVLF
jgi:hypothetical protein